MEATKYRGARLSFIDAAKGVGILMIMFGHITSLSNPVDSWMSSFKISVFYVVTGYLYSYTQTPIKRNFGEFSKRLFETLLIPYLWFSLFGSLFKAACVLLRHEGLTEALLMLMRCLANTLVLKGINSLWFIPTTIIGALVFYGLLHAPKGIQLTYAIFGPFAVSIARQTVLASETLTGTYVYWLVILAGKLIPVVGKGLMAAWFMGTGYLWQTACPAHNRNNTSKELWAGIALCIVNICLSRLNHGAVDINLLREGSRPWLFYASGVVGSFGLLLLLKSVCSTHATHWLEYLGKNSFVIMATQTVFGLRDIAYAGWDSLVPIPTAVSFEYIFECFMALLVLVLLEYAAVEIINSHFPFLLGKRRTYN